MKILLVNTRHFYGGGDSTYTFNLANLLKSKGHEVAFFAMQDERNLPDPDADLFVSHIDFRALNQKKNLVIGVQVLTRSTYSIEARRKFAKLLDRIKPDIVHLQNIHAHITPSVIFEARKRGVAVVWTLHDYKQVCPNSTFMIDRTNEICEACQGGRFYQSMIMRCKKNSLLACAMITIEAYTHQLIRVRQKVNAFLAPSVFMRNKLLENGFDTEKTYHLPLFVPQSVLGELDHNQQFGKYFLFLGRLDNDKGLYTLIEACRLAPHINVVLSGRVQEPIKTDLIDHLPENVKYVGMNTGAKLDELRRNSLAFVLPSLSYENQPFSVLEAFAFGKPVIASRLGGISELVGNDERGFLVPPANPKLLGATMGYAVQNLRELAEKGRKARVYVIENHSPETHYARLYTIYQKVIQEKKNAPE